MSWNVSNRRLRAVETVGERLGRGLYDVSEVAWVDAGVGMMVMEVGPPLPPDTTYRGDVRLLEQPLTALLCSNRCPGDIILKIYDLARAMRDDATATIGGFQTPMEKECLRLLLRGKQAVVVCPARGIERMRIPRDWRTAIDENRLLVLSPFPSAIRRPTIKMAYRRNDLVAALANRVFVTHAARGGKTEALACRLAASGKPLLTLDSPANANLVGLGAEVVEVPAPPSLTERLADWA